MKMMVPKPDDDDDLGLLVLDLVATAWVVVDEVGVKKQNKKKAPLMRRTAMAS